MIFTLWSAGTEKYSIPQILIFYLLIITWSGHLAGDEVIWLYLKIPENLMCLIFLDKLWIVSIPFGIMVKSEFFALFPVDNLPHPVMFSLILFLYYFAIFAYDMINSFVSLTTWSIFDVFLRLIYFHLNIVDFHGV